MDKPLEERELNDPLDEERAQSIVARILARRGTALESTEGQDHSWDAGMLEREARAGTRRIQSQRNDREDISEVEYRQIRLERRPRGPEDNPKRRRSRHITQRTRRARGNGRLPGP